MGDVARSGTPDASGAKRAMEGAGYAKAIVLEDAIQYVRVLVSAHRVTRVVQHQ